ncbi:hypothetical protein CISIN_1g042605mg, partial [Citrus sinensis]
KFHQKQHLNLLLATLRSNTTHCSSDKFSEGLRLFLCCGDVSTESCKDCVNFATSHITQLCPVRKETVIWYSECLLRYSNVSFFSAMDTKPFFYTSSTQNSTSRRLFEQQVWSLMNEALNRALSTTKCLGQQTKITQTARRMSAVSSYNIRYELYPFYNDTLIASPTSAPAQAPSPVVLPLPSPGSVTSAQGKGTKATWIAIGTTIPTIL